MKKKCKKMKITAEHSIVFVYTKNDKIKVLTHKKSLNEKPFLDSNGFIHTATLDACVYIENLCNHATRPKNELKKLTKRWK